MKKLRRRWYRMGQDTLTFKETKLGGLYNHKYMGEVSWRCSLVVHQLLQHENDVPANEAVRR